MGEGALPQGGGAVPLFRKSGCFFTLLGGAPSPSYVGHPLSLQCYFYNANWYFYQCRMHCELWDILYIKKLMCVY